VYLVLKEAGLLVWHAYHLITSKASKPGVYLVLKEAGLLVWHAYHLITSKASKPGVYLVLKEAGLLVWHAYHLMVWAVLILEFQQSDDPHLHVAA
jgi:hypothetical protein